MDLKMDMSILDEEEAEEDETQKDSEKILFEGRFLTTEQEAVVRHDAGPGDKVVINAFGGAGKTTTMRALVQHKRSELAQNDDRRVLYVVYGEYMATSAQKAFNVDEDPQMAKLVDVRTYHSLVLMYFKTSLAKRGIFVEENAVFDFQTQGSPFGLHEDRDKKCIETLKRFCHDPSIEHQQPQPCHVVDPLVCKQAKEVNVEITLGMLKDDEKLALAKSREIWHDVINARRRGDRINATTGKQERYVECSHDFTLKWFCLNAQDAEEFVVERYHVLLMDEAQDTQRPLLSWLLEHVHQFAVYLVGDTFQSIFAFTGAHDAIEMAITHPQAKLFRLTESFRFGSKIASACTALLHGSFLLPRNIEIKGNDARRGCGTVHALSRDAIPQVAHELVKSVFARTGCRDIALLSRKNDPAMLAAITLYKNGFFVRLAGHLAEYVESVLEVLKKYKSDADIAQKQSDLFRHIGMLEKRQLVWRHHVLSGATPPRSSGYDEKGFVRGRLRLTEQEAFEEQIVVNTEGHLRETYNLFYGIHQQTKAKTVPANVVVVTVCTVHAAKGGEWDAVVVMDDFPELDLCVRARIGTFTHDDYMQMQREKIGVQHNNHDITHSTLMDYFKTQDKTPLLQEIHLFYVAMTRAKMHLFVNAPAANVVNSIIPLETMELSAHAMEIVASRSSSKSTGTKRPSVGAGDGTEQRKKRTVA